MKKGKLKLAKMKVHPIARADEKPKKGKKPRQIRMPGTGGNEEKNPEVHAAGVAYVEARDTRMEASREEKLAKTSLINMMAKHGVDVFKDTEADPPVIIAVSTKTDVKVTELGEDEAESPPEVEEAEERADESEPPKEEQDTGDDREREDETPPGAA